MSKKPIKSLPVDNSSQTEYEDSEIFSESDDEIFMCHLCNVKCGRKDTLDRHCRTSAKHKNNIKKQKAIVNGNMNSVIVGNNNTIKTTNKNYTVNVIKLPNSFLDVSIDDLSLLNQYFILVSGNRPYQNILDNLNFHPDKSKHHNIEYENAKFLKLHNGNNSFSSPIDDAIKDIIMTDRELLCAIFNRFRIFMGTRIHKQNTYHLYSGLPCCKPEYKNLSSAIKRHISNKQGDKTYPKVSDKNIPNKDDPVWDHLSKTFSWNETSTYINKLLEINIDLDRTLGDIKKDIIAYIKKCEGEQKKTESKFFNKLLNRLALLSYRYNYPQDSQSSSGTDEQKKYVRHRKKINNQPISSDSDTEPIRKKKKVSKFNDEINSIETNKDDKIRYIGATHISQVAKKFKSSSSEDSKKKPTKKSR